MQNSERQMAVLKNVWIHIPSDRKYDLYLTDKRMILIHAGGNFAISFLGGIPYLIGVGVESLKESQNKQKEKGMTLEELLQDKKNFEVDYEHIQRLKLHDSRWGRHNLDITSDTKQKSVCLWLNKEQFEQLSNVLPNIPALKGKLEN